MIDNIVELPRPLGRNRGCFSVSSYSAYEPPASPLGMALGITTEIRDMPICVGSEFYLITGPDAMWRYKILEHDEKYIREFLTVSDGPLLSENSKFFTLWADEISKDTLLRKRSYMWDRIESARKYFSFHMCPCMSKDVYDAVRLYGTLIGAPWIPSKYNWPHLRFNVADADNSSLDDMFRIKGNLAAIEEAVLGDSFIHELDVYRGVTEADGKIHLDSGLSRLLTGGTVTYKDLKKFIGPNYATRINPLIPVSDKLTDNAIKDAANDCNGWIDVFKYISDIPYSEVFALLDKDGYKVIRVFDPYDRPRSVELDLSKLDESVKESFDKVAHHLGEIQDEDLKSLYKGDFTSCKFYRSWSEEVYITFKEVTGGSRTYYFDQAYMAMSLPMFTDPNTVS